MTNTNIKAVNSVLLKLKEPVKTVIETETGFKLELAGNFNIEWNVTVQGVIESLPKNSPYLGEIKKGDEVCFSYFIVNDRSFDTDVDMFNPSIESNYMQQFIDGRGARINIIAVPGIITKKWVCSYIDENGNFVHGFEGTESEMERWKSQYKFGSVQKFKFENLIDYNSEHYWRCDNQFLFAKIVDGKLVSLGDRVILTPIDIDVPKETLTAMGIKIPDTSVQARLSDRAMVYSGGERMGIKQGDTVGFDPRFVEKYEFNNKQYFLLREDRVLGTWN
jgi:co-chaperonin GroES (HSP10)